MVPLKSEPVESFAFFTNQTRRNERPNLLFILVLLSIASGTTHASAQDPRIDRALNIQAESVAFRASGFLSPTEDDFSNELFAPSSPGDDDLGIQLLLKEERELKFWTIYGSAMGTYTTNAPLIREPQLDDAFLTGTIGVQYSRPLTPQLSITAGISEQWIRYEEFSFLDFDAFTGNIGLGYYEPRLWDLSFYLRYGYDRLSTATLSSAFFQNHTITLGAQRFVPLTRAHYFYFGAEAEWGWGIPSQPQRDEYVIYGGYNVNLSRWIAGQVFFRGGIYEYNFIDRTDYNQTVGLALAWRMNDYMTLSAQLTHNLNRSNRAVFDYGALNVGGGLQASFQF